MMMADNNTSMPEAQFPADYTTGPTVIPPDADMSQFNDVTGTMLPPTNYDMDMMQNTLPQKEQISPMGTPMTRKPMTLEEIDEQMRQLEILRNDIMMGN